ncbi:MAG: hypothetical protein ACXABY_36885, partial [Candidatus Thorarchaeota archaeon]|jgi:hypothetical protein
MSIGRIVGQIETQLWDVAGYPWLKDVYRDNDGSLYAIVAKDGMLFRVGIDVDGETVILGEFEQVTVVHEPTGRMVIRQQENGQFRWFSVSSTAILNRMGEIDSSDLYDSFIAHAEETGEYPIRDFYHLGEVFRTGQFDFLARDGFVLITSGLYDDSELAKMEIKARQKNPDYWGDSIRFLPTEDAEMLEIGGVEIPVYRAGVLVQVSTLPESDAAAWFTNGIVKQEVSRMLDKRTLGAFVELFDGDEDAAEAWLTENAEGLNRSIEEGNYIARETEDGASEDGETPDGAADAVSVGQELVVDLDESLVDEVVRQLEGSENFVVLVLPDLSSRITALEKDEQERKVEFLGTLPVTPRVRASYRPRQVAQPVEGEEEEKSKGPDLSDIKGAY